MAKDKNNSLICAHCKAKIPRGTAYSNRIVSFSVSDKIQLEIDPSDPRFRQTIQSLLESIDWEKSEKKLMDEVCRAYEFHLCSNCREAWIDQIHSFAGSSGQLKL